MNENVVMGKYFNKTTGILLFTDHTVLRNLPQNTIRDKISTLNREILRKLLWLHLVTFIGKQI